MRNRFLLYVIPASVLAMTSCNDVVAPLPGVVTVSAPSIVSLTADFDSNNDTKTTVVNGGTSVYWETGEEIMVFNNGKSGKFTSSNTTQQATAVFTGALEVDRTKPYIAAYPYAADVSLVVDSVMVTLPDSQTGREGSFDKGMNISVAKSATSKLTFKNVCSGIRFYVTEPAISKAVLTGNSGETLAGKLVVNIAGDNPAVARITSPKTSITLTPPGSDKYFKQGKWYYFVIAPVTFSKGFSIKFTNGTLEKSFKYDNNLSAIRGQYISKKAADSTLFSIDMGLSVCWANQNLGTTTDDLWDFGTYFAWGETASRSTTSFTWENYSLSGNTETSMTKYCTSADYGTVDNKTTLETADDAVSVILKNGYRIPTKSEWQELINACDWTLEPNGGYTGTLKSDNTKKIHLPAAGQYVDQQSWPGGQGYYWTSSLHPTVSNQACTMYFYGETKPQLDNFLGSCSSLRKSGLPIRPVRPK